MSAEEKRYQAEYRRIWREIDARKKTLLDTLERWKQDKHLATSEEIDRLYNETIKEVDRLKKDLEELRRLIRTRSKGRDQTAK
jgi:hypothetical protein